MSGFSGCLFFLIFLEDFMNAFNTVNILESIIPISQFNKGQANKIFSDVKKHGTRIVVKNNIPECILISPQNYQKMLEEYEDAILAVEAQKRETQEVDYISQEEIFTKYNISEKDLDDIEVNLE